eukprot:224747_1
MNYNLRTRNKRNHNPKIRIVGCRQPIIKSLEYETPFESWHGYQYRHNKQFHFDGPNHFHLLHTAKLVKVDDEPQVWGKTITNYHIEEEDRLTKDEVPLIYVLDALESDLDFLLSINWIRNKEVKPRLIPSDKRYSLLKFKGGEQAWHQPPSCMYCSHSTNCKCPKKPVLVVITEVDPHIFFDQMRPEYKFRVKFPSRRTIGDGWAGEESLKKYEPNVYIGNWYFDEDQIHLANLRRSIKSGRFLSFSCLSRIPKENRTLDCCIDSALFGK